MSIEGNGDKLPNCFNGSYWLFCYRKIILLDFTFLIFCHNSFLCVLLSFEVTCEHAWSLCYVGSMNVELEGQKCCKGLRAVKQDKRDLRFLGSNRPFLLTSV